MTRLVAALLTIPLTALFFCGASAAKATPKQLPGNAVPCNAFHVNHDDWNDPNIYSHANCPANTKVVGGGCTFTCLGTEFHHFITVPTSNPEGWQCAIISDDATRTFAAVAICE